MKKNIIYIALVLILVVVVVAYFLSNPMSTMKSGSNFAIKDISSISKIQIKKSNKFIELSKQGETWMVNESYFAHKQTIESFLTVLSNLEVFSSVSKAEKNAVADKLRSHGVKVNIYKGTKVMKTYFVGSLDSGQTVMIGEKSNDPYIMRMPSFKGELSAFYKTNKDYWRSRVVFDIEPQDITSIKCNHPAKPDKSFKVINYHDGSFGLMSLYPEKGIENYEVEQVVRYFAYFRALHFEEVAKNLTANQKRKIITSEPIYDIELIDIHEAEYNFKVYLKPESIENIGSSEMIAPDYNRAYAILNNSEEILIIQYYIFDPIFKEIDYFRKP